MIVGDALGWSDGSLVVIVGDALGWPDGSLVGWSDSDALGWSDGSLVVIVGALVMHLVTWLVGRLAGCDTCSCNW